MTLAEALGLLVYVLAGYVGARTGVRGLRREVAELRAWAGRLASHVHYPEPVPVPAEKPHGDPHPLG